MAASSSPTHHDDAAADSTSPQPSKSQGKLLEELSDWPQTEIDDLVNTIKAARETESIRDRFPAGLAEVAARIRVVSPAETTSANQYGGAYGTQFASFEHKLHLSVDRAIRPIEGQLPVSSTCQLDITATRWETHAYYLTGGADSATWTVIVRYDGESKTAKTSCYGDPGRGVVWAVHGDMKGFLGVILQDLGVDGTSESGVLNGLQLLTLLLGDETAKRVLDDPIDHDDAENYPSLRVTIEEEHTIDSYD